MPVWSGNTCPLLSSLRPPGHARCLPDIFASAAADGKVRCHKGGLILDVKLDRMARKNPAITVAVISALGLIIAAVIGAFLHPSSRGAEPQPQTTLVVAGTVVDQATNRGVGQAVLSIAGRAETYVTEDNGNFRLDIRGTLEGGRARLHVAKQGYAPY